MAETNLTFDVLARDSASRTFQKIGRNTDSLTRKMGSLSRTARVALGGFAAFEAARAVKAIASIGIAYQDSLNIFQSVSRANADQMQRVADKAKQLGANLKLPTTSAADAAAAMTELAKGGLNVRQSMQAALGTLQLATAAQVDGAQAAQIQSAALAQFGLSGKSAGHVADLLANAANAAQGEITDMATALTYVGPIARSVGISIDDTAASIALLAKNGILGQKAGTGLRGLIVGLEKPSTDGAKALKALGVDAFDAQGNFVGLRKVIEELNKAQGEFTHEGFNKALATAFGRQNLSAVTAFAAEGARGFDHFTEATGRAGGAAKVAEARSRGLGGALRGLKSQMETLAISIYQKLAPGLERIVRGASEKLPGFIDRVKAAIQKARPDLENFAHNAARFAQALGAALASLRPFAQFVGTVLVGAFRAVSGAMGKLADAPDLVKKITKAVIIGWGAWKTYTYWTRAAATATLAFGGGAGAKGAGGAAGRGGIIGVVAGLTAKLVGMAKAARLSGAAWLGLGRAVSLAGASVFAASQDTASATQVNAEAIRLARSDYLKYTAQLKTTTGTERQHILSLRAGIEAYLKANQVTTVNGRILESLSGTLRGLPGLYAAATSGVQAFVTALGGGGVPQSPFRDPGHPGYVPPGSKTSGGHHKDPAVIDAGTRGFNIGKATSDGVAAGMKAAQSKVVTAAQSMVDRIDQQFKALTQSARQMARSIADTFRSSAELTNVSQTDTLGAAMAPSIAGIKSFLHDQLKQDRQFRRHLKMAQSKGLSQALYRQLAQAGPEAAGGIAAALAGASRADLRSISQQNRQIGGLGDALGHRVSQDVYAARLREAHGDQVKSHQLLKHLIDAVKDDSLTSKDIHKLGREFRQAIHHLNVKTDTAKQDHKQGLTVKAG